MAKRALTTLALLLIAAPTTARAAETTPNSNPTVYPSKDETQPQPDSQSAAAEQAPADNAPANAAASNKKWEFATIGYAWLAGAYGRTTPRKPLPAVDLNLSFIDALKAFKFAFMGGAEARNDRLVFLGDLFWVHLGEDQGLKVRDRQFADVKINAKSWEVTGLAGYRVADNGPVKIDVLAGGRLNGQTQSVRYKGQILDLKGEVSETWFDPIVATRISAPLGGKFSATAYGDIGGFGVGSKITWQAIGTGNYQINRKMTLGLGWRYWKVNFHGSKGFYYNVGQSGPFIAVRTVF